MDAFQKTEGFRWMKIWKNRSGPGENGCAVF